MSSLVDFIVPLPSVAEVKHSLDMQRAAYHEAHKRAKAEAEHSREAAVQAEGLVRDAGELPYTSQGYM